MVTDKERYFARSASDKTDEWPFWFVADRNNGGLNVTETLFNQLSPTPMKKGALFLYKESAERLAKAANQNDR